jgi:phospholipase C
VSHTRYDHTSVLRLIEWRWRLEPLTVRDRTAKNLAGALDFSRKDLRAPRFAVPPGPFGAPCPSAVLEQSDLAALKELALQYGWPVY